MLNLKVSLKKTICLLILVSIGYILFIYTAIIDFERSKFTNNESIFKRQGNKKIIIAFRNDDITIHSNVSQVESVLNIFWKYRVKQTFAFIPRLGNKKIDKNNSSIEKYSITKILENWFKQGKIEFALHGYEHKKSAGSIGEFDGMSYNKQFVRISNGKKILEKVLNSHVNIFAPPWNQADSNTVKACFNSEIKIFTGYLGQIPLEGMTFVNTNAVLFRKTNPMAEDISIPTIEEVLTYAKNSKGTTFIIVFYHSSNDFKNNNDYAYLINILKNITKNPMIEVSSIGEIAKKYKDLLPAFNQAGLNIKQASMSQYRAKPYIVLYKKFCNIIGEEFSIELLYKDAFHAYWGGNYKKASMLSHEIIKKCDFSIILGRIFAILSSGAIFFLLLWAFKNIKVRAHLFYFRLILWISTAPFIATAIFLNICRPVSNIRIEEYNTVFWLYVGGILPKALIERLLEAAQQLDSEGFENVVAEIENQSAPLAGTLRDLAMQFRFDVVIKAIERATDRRGAEIRGRDKGLESR